MNFFMSGWLLGLSIAIPFGPVGAMCLERSLSRGVLRGLASGAGAATTHAIYATLAVVGANAVAAPLVGLQAHIHMLSGVILTVLGIRTLLRVPASRLPLGRQAGALADYLSGFGLALTNPMTLLPYIAFAGSVMLTQPTGGAISAMVVAGISLGTLTWYGTLCGSAWALRQRLPQKLHDHLNHASGTLLIAMGLLTAIG